MCVPLQEVDPVGGGRMKVIVHDRYWEGDLTYTDVIRIEEKRFAFVLVRNGGFAKEFDNERYRYKVENDER